MILFILINPISLMSKLQRYIPRKKRWWALIIIAAAIAAIVSGRKEQEKASATDYDPETTPTMFTSDATSYVSDSGYTRYYIETTQWYVFDEAKEPNWKFPEGLYGEKFDNDMAVIATFECDSAIYLSQPRLWELIGNVRINNELGDRFLTQHLFWNTVDHKMYSDSFIHIEKSDRIIEGYGFVSDERISDYVVNRPSMIIPASELNRDRSAGGSEAPDSINATPADTMSAGAARRRPPRPREGYTPATPGMTPGGALPGSHNAAKQPPAIRPAQPAVNPAINPADRKRTVTQPPSALRTIESDKPLKARPAKMK